VVAFVIVGREHKLNLSAGELGKLSNCTAQKALVEIKSHEEQSNNTLIRDGPFNPAEYKKQAKLRRE